MDDTFVYAVLDTWVLVSAHRSSLGASFEVLRLVRRGDIRIALSVALAIEYEAVALRPGLVPALTAEEIRVVVDVLCRLAQPQRVFFTWRPFLPDPNDDFVLELAAAAGCAFVITHNIKDFKGSESLGISPAMHMSPAQLSKVLSGAVHDTSYRAWSGPKFCGGFHPDLLVRFWCDLGVIDLHLCFGCNEAQLFDGSTLTHVDLLPTIADDLKRLQQDCPTKRPVQQQPTRGDAIDSLLRSS